MEMARWSKEEALKSPQGYADQTDTLKASQA